MKHANGFTIVELLIVIVVIAILASLSYVGYTSIRDRAMLVQQTADLDKIGKAIQLWSAENGKTLGESGAGVEGLGLGWINGKGGSSYTAMSVEDLLRESGYLLGQIESFSLSDVLVAPCTDFTDNRWLVFAKVSPSPRQSVADQLTKTGCNSSYTTGYSSVSYGTNLIKAY